MSRATVVKEIFFETKDEIGLLGRTISALAVEGVYIEHLAAYKQGDKSYIHAITKDNAKAASALLHFVPKVEEKEVVMVEFENKVGTLAEVAKVLGNHGVSIECVYGTSSDGFKIVGIFTTADNQKAAKVINEETGSLSAGS